MKLKLRVNLMKKCRCALKSELISNLITGFRIIGVPLDGTRDILGQWIENTAGASIALDHSLAHPLAGCGATQHQVAITVATASSASRIRSTAIILSCRHRLGAVSPGCVRPIARCDNQNRNKAGPTRQPLGYIPDDC